MEQFSYHMKHPYCVCIDSDGTVFENMELKHKECFCPAFIYAFDLQSVSRYAREVWEYINLYSPGRGCNRFKAMLDATQILRSRKEVRKRKVSIPDLSGLADCIEKGYTSHTNLLEYAKEHPENEAIRKALLCSEEINRNVAYMVHHVPPLSQAVEFMNQAGKNCDLIIVSDTPNKNLMTEWENQNIRQIPDYFTGQEFGGKGNCLAAVLEQNPVEKDRVLMIGDAPRDLSAAKQKGVLFFPIVPRREEESWEELLIHGFPKFIEGSFAGQYEDGLIDRYKKSLDSMPSWEEKK